MQARAHKGGVVDINNCSFCPTLTARYTGFDVALHSFAAFCSAVRMYSLSFLLCFFYKNARRSYQQMKIQNPTRTDKPSQTCLPQKADAASRLPTLINHMSERSLQYMTFRYTLEQSWGGEKSRFFKVLTSTWLENQTVKRTVGFSL